MVQSFSDNDVQILSPKLIFVKPLSGFLDSLPSCDCTTAKKCNLGRLLAVLNDVSRNSVDGDDNLSR